MKEEKIEEKIDINIIRINDMEKIIKNDVEKGRKNIEEKVGVKIGIIKKCSFDTMPHMIVNIGEEDIWLEGPVESFEKGDYAEGIKIEIIGKDIGTIVGECDFGKIEHLSLYVADYVRIIP